MWLWQIVSVKHSQSAKHRPCSMLECGAHRLFPYKQLKHPCREHTQLEFCEFSLWFCSCDVRIALIFKLDWWVGSKSQNDQGSSMIVVWFHDSACYHYNHIPIFLVQVQLRQKDTNPKFDPTRVQTHDLQNISEHFMSLRRFVLTTEAIRGPL